MAPARDISGPDEARSSEKTSNLALVLEELRKK